MEIILQVSPGVEGLAIELLQNTSWSKDFKHPERLKSGFISVEVDHEPRVFPKFILNWFAWGELTNLDPKKGSLKDYIEESAVSLLQRVSSRLNSEPFRVTGIRHHRHKPISSQDLASYLGAKIREIVPAPVSMKDFRHEYVLEWWDDLMFFGERKNRKVLDGSDQKPFHPRGAFRHANAQLLIDWAAPQNHETVIDAFAGSGTFGLLLRQSGFQGKLFSVESHPRMLQGMKGNYEAMNLVPPDQIIAKDFFEKFDLGDDGGRADLLFANPPFGVHFGRKISFPRFYQLFLKRLTQLLKPGGRALVVIYKKDTFLEQLKLQSDISSLEFYQMYMGGVSVHLHLLKLVTRTGVTF